MASPVFQALVPQDGDDAAGPQVLSTHVRAHARDGTPWAR